ncbi:MAG: diguanylate cyclase [Armatimonadetes bacterium]|nr:diguanylate cyclase [Armatimonadota bacterium]
MQETDRKAEALQGLWQRLRAVSIERLQFLQAGLRRPVDEHSRQQLLRAAHQLAGSLGGFGFRLASQVAGELERLLDSNEPLEVHALRLETLCCRLADELEGNPDPEAARELDRPPSLFLISEDLELRRELVAESAVAGYDVILAEEPQQARHQLRDSSLIVFDLPREGAVGWSQDELSHRPLLVLLPEDRLEDRLRAARLGAQRVLERPLNASRVFEEARRCLDEVSGEAVRVLAVDDDPVVLATLAAVLEPLNIRFTGLQDPGHFWEALETSVPDLLVLDLAMPGFSGIDLCRSVRTSSRWSDLPVLFLTVKEDALSRREIFRAGADDYIPKPVVAEEIRQRVANRLSRARDSRRLADMDSLTRASTRRKAITMLGHYLKLCERRALPMSFALLDIDHFKHVNDTYGHPAGDRVLKRLGELLLQAFRGEDVVARWGGEEFAVGTFTMRRDDAVRRLTGVLEQFREEQFQGGGGQQFQVTFSAGVAQYPQDGGDLEALYTASDAALYRAKQAGRNRILIPSILSTSPPQLDVLLVQKQERSAEPLLAAARRQGLRAAWVNDARLASELLTQPDVPVNSRVLVFDTDESTLSLSCLMSDLAAGGVLKGLQVIVVGSSPSEEQVAEAFQLGAFDHLSKPVHPAALARKLERMLRAHAGPWVWTTGR